MGCWDEIEAGAREAMEAAGPEMVEFIQELISVPVVVTQAGGRPPLAPSRSRAGQSRAKYWAVIPMGVAPRLGGVIERSKPGEPPRLETGRLYHSIGQVVSAGAGISLSITSEAPYKWQLQQFLDRPYISTTFNQFVPTLPQRILMSIRARFGVNT